MTNCRYLLKCKNIPQVIIKFMKNFNKIPNSAKHYFSAAANVYEGCCGRLSSASRLHWSSPVTCYQDLANSPLHEI